MRAKPQSGFILIGSLLLVAFFMTSALAVAQYGLNHYTGAKRSLYALEALSAAEAGAEKFMLEVNKDKNHSGSGSEVQLSNANGIRTTYQTTVQAGINDSEKIVFATGRTYVPASAATPRVVRKLRLSIIGTTPVPYIVQTGPGGLILSNSATVGNGEVYVNGYITMSNSARIGSSTSPSKVWVAHQTCPTGGGSTYPRVCNDGENNQPINISNTAHIYGEVRATNQTNGSKMSNPGLIAGSTAPPVALPEYDREAQKASVASTLTGSAASCSNSQQKSWPANVHITGNVTLSNSCRITVNGNAWIDGSLSISNSAIIRVADGLTSGPNIMIDGSGGLSLSNSAVVSVNSLSHGFKFITYHSSATCSPNCANVTGTDLKNSQSVTTINISNSAAGSGSIFYARWSKLNLSNGSSAGALIGQTIQLSNSGNISFSTQETIGGGSTWDVRHWQQVFD